MNEEDYKNIELPIKILSNKIKKLEINYLGIISAGKRLAERIEKLERQFNDEAKVNEEIDQEHSERIKELENKVN